LNLLQKIVLVVDLKMIDKSLQKLQNVVVVTRNLVAILFWLIASVDYVSINEL